MSQCCTWLTPWFALWLSDVTSLLTVGTSHAAIAPTTANAARNTAQVASNGGHR